MPAGKGISAAQPSHLLCSGARSGVETPAMLQQLRLAHGKGAQRWTPSHGCQPEIGCQTLSCLSLTMCHNDLIMGALCNSDVAHSLGAVRTQQAVLSLKAKRAQ